MAWTDYRNNRMVADMVACIATDGVGLYARQGWAGGDGVWEWDSTCRTPMGEQRKQREVADGGREIRAQR